MDHGDKLASQTLGVRLKADNESLSVAGGQYRHAVASGQPFATRLLVIRRVDPTLPRDGTDLIAAEKSL